MTKAYALQQIPFLITPCTIKTYVINNDENICSPTNSKL